MFLNVQVLSQTISVFWFCVVTQLVTVTQLKSLDVIHLILITFLAKVLERVVMAQLQPLFTCH